MRFLGVDLGTTSLSAAMIDLETGKVLATRNRAHHAEVAPDAPGAHAQDPDALVAGARALIELCQTEFGDLAGIGVTGQMHGILYIDAGGRAVSPLYTWLDRQAERLAEGGKAYLELFAELTGEAVPLGYGAVTHFTQHRQGRIPDAAVSFCTAADYLVMRLAGLAQPLIDPTLAHSLGLFELEQNTFGASWTALGDRVRLPTLVTQGAVAGRLENTPVVTALADNQASFIGSVGESRRSVLVTLGTSGQVTCLGDAKPDSSPELELRPFPGGGYLFTGASLTGGKAFEVLTGLIDSVALRLTGERASDPYALLGGPDTVGPPYLRVDTRFAGSRGGAKSGGIHGITLANLTLEHLAYGFAQGVVDELYAFWTGAFTRAGVTAQITELVGSGNAVRQSRLVRERLGETFGLPLRLTQHAEEAAVGAALYAAAVVSDRPLGEVAQSVLRAGLLG